MLRGPPVTLRPPAAPGGDGDGGGGGLGGAAARPSTSVSGRHMVSAVQPRRSAKGDVVCYRYVPNPGVHLPHKFTRVWVFVF